jgi:thioredoxin 1
LKISLFSSESCGICHSIKPKIERISKEFSIPFEVIDIQKNPEFSTKFLVFSVPTVLILDGEREINRWAGVFSIDEIQSYLKRMKDVL